MCGFVVVVIIIIAFLGGVAWHGFSEKVIILEFTNLCLCFQSIRKLESMIKEAEER